MGHARQARKNRILLTGSFALSIILFLRFSVLIDVVNYVMSQSAAASDLDIFSDEEEKIPAQMVENIRKVDGVKEVYGRLSGIGSAGRSSRFCCGSVVFLLLTVTVAMREPVKRICEMPVTEIIKAY